MACSSWYRTTQGLLLCRMCTVHIVSLSCRPCPRKLDTNLWLLGHWGGWSEGFFFFFFIHFISHFIAFYISCYLTFHLILFFNFMKLHSPRRETNPIRLHQRLTPSLWSTQLPPRPAPPCRRPKYPTAAGRPRDRSTPFSWRHLHSLFRSPCLFSTIFWYHHTGDNLHYWCFKPT